MRHKENSRRQGATPEILQVNEQLKGRGTAANRAPSSTHSMCVMLGSFQNDGGEAEPRSQDWLGYAEPRCLRY